MNFDSAIFHTKNFLPFNAMCRSENVAVVDEHTSAVEFFEIWQLSHPGELVDSRFMTVNNTGHFIPLATFWNI